MNENRLRRKGRIGALRSAAAVIGVLAALALFLVVIRLPDALSNPGEPEPVSLSQLAGKEIGTGRYVTVSGIALYDIGITESDDSGNLVGFVYPLLDMDGKALIFVRSSQPKVDGPRNDHEEVTITGTVRGLDSSIQTLIAKEVPDIEAGGIAVAADVNVVQRQKPGSVSTLIVLAVLLGLLILLCLVPFFFPYPLFGPYPVQPAVAPAAIDPGVKVTGRFQRLKKVEPAIEVGKGTRMFREAPGNIVTLTDGRLMIYIRVVSKYAAVITIGTSHWAFFPEPQNMVVVEPGKVYGWRDRPAVRICYMGDKRKVHDLILSFNQGAAQAEFVSLLEHSGFSVSSGL